MLMPQASVDVCQGGCYAWKNKSQARETMNVEIQRQNRGWCLQGIGKKIIVLGTQCQGKQNDEHGLEKYRD